MCTGIFLPHPCPHLPPEPLKGLLVKVLISVDLHHLDGNLSPMVEAPPHLGGTCACVHVSCVSVCVCVCVCVRVCAFVHVCEL